MYIYSFNYNPYQKNKWKWIEINKLFVLFKTKSVFYFDKHCPAEKNAFIGFISPLINKLANIVLDGVNIIIKTRWIKNFWIIRRFSSPVESTFWNQNSEQPSSCTYLAYKHFELLIFRPKICRFKISKPYVAGAAANLRLEFQTHSIS